MIEQDPHLIFGGTHSDERGTVSFCNEFDMCEIRRVYQIKNSIEYPMRGWQAHKVETKWFSCLHGAFKVALVRLKDWTKPEANQEVKTYLLKADDPAVLFVPANYANAIISMEQDSVLTVYSNKTLEEAQEDQYRFPLEQWSPL